MSQNNVKQVLPGGRSPPTRWRKNWWEWWKTHPKATLTETEAAAARPGGSTAIRPQRCMDPADRVMSGSHRQSFDGCWTKTMEGTNELVR